jgi:hypothetical protein
VTPLQSVGELKRLREYRSRIVNELHSRCIKFSAALNASKEPNVAKWLAYHDVATKRIRLANARIDAIEDFFPRTA